jgi:hypothetical protein
MILAAMALSLGLAGLGGCSDDTTGPDTGGDVNTDAIVAPKQGSTYTYAVYDTDSTGKKVSGTDRTEIYTVTSASLTLGGKSNVTMFVSNAAEPDTGYIHYETNGDVTIYQAEEEAGVTTYSWITLPFVSRSTHNITLIDSTIDDGFGNNGQIKFTSQTTGTGSEKITVGTEEFKANRATWKIDATFPLLGLSVTSTTTSTLSFVPKIGFWVKQETKSTGSLGPLGGSTKGQVSTLTSYSLK